jgi:nucleoside phosphorylase
MTMSSDARASQLPRPAPLLVAAAVPRELAPLVVALEAPASTAIGRAQRPAVEGRLDGRDVLLLATGVGKAAAAASVAAALETRAVAGVLACGVAGAYPGARLRVCDVALGREEILAHDLDAARLRERTGALVESMEGAAIAAMALRYGVPMLELRAVSNLTQDRDLRQWDLEGAIAAAARAATALVAAGVLP